MHTLQKCTCNGKLVRAHPCGGNREAGECLEIQSYLTHIVGGLNARYECDEALMRDTCVMRYKCDEALTRDTSGMRP